MSQQKIAEKLGITRQQVCRIEQKILKDISVKLKKLGIIDVTFNQNSTRKEKMKKITKKT